ncbi:MAG: hypothetical protein J4N67_03230 [Chloroflexi bacterium]|nr:hypothetical protein [Chloroflexota bacterium]MCI0810145.1 hypothetical protein [Chloroflexota bacterium]MCI0829124.1 hypothetical protein [Chloroflexota bacterium]MCI0847839.1 hypothetical protein [Chloroflexota bacterium]
MRAGTFVKAAVKTPIFSHLRYPMFDDPKALTSVEWNNIHMFLQWFWIYFPIVVTFGITLLIAHAIIPSLVNTGHLPESTQKLRVPLTGFAVLLFAAGTVILILGVNATLDVGAIYNRWFI